MALIGGILSLAGSILTAWAAMADQGAETSQARLSTAQQLLAYSLPIVAANLLYTAIPLANRALITHLYGFAETGQFSLAYDLGLRAVLAGRTGRFCAISRQSRSARVQWFWFSCRCTRPHPVC